jgi:hypothetical protein
VGGKCDYALKLAGVAAQQLSESCLPDDHSKFVFNPGILLTANSTTTLSSSSAETQTVLLDAINHLREDEPNTTIASSTGHYITPAGDSRVVWTRHNDKILVVTIFAPST